MRKKYQVNGKTIYITPIPFTGKKDIVYYKKQIFSSLKKIGVEDTFISMFEKEKTVTLVWEINNQRFQFTCGTQESLTHNYGAIAQAIQEDVRQITRGIKDLDLTMKQYLQETQFEGEARSEKESVFSKFEKRGESVNTISLKERSDVEILTKADARKIIQEIKKKYSSFSDLKYIPEEDKEILRKAYLYLGVHPKF
jgi:hypothetical protein